jgi:hypothetical protein
MRSVELAALYALIGVGCASALLLRGDAHEKRWLDAALMLAFWPVCAPFWWSRAGDGSAPASSEIAFLAALRRAAGTPLAALLPDEATARALGRRLRVASGKLREIDALLRRPEFDDREAERRRVELVQRGASEPALASAGMRLQNIRRLRALRDRFARELVVLEELLTELTTQAEVVRLAGVPDSDAQDLVREILSRVEGLDAVLGEEADGLPPLAETR